MSTAKVRSAALVITPELLHALLDLPTDTTIIGADVDQATGGIAILVTRNTGFPARRVTGEIALEWGHAEFRGFRPA